MLADNGRQWNYSITLLGDSLGALSIELVPGKLPKIS